MNKRSAFTLIELLIVVAIIAILAAIAVPNFLEAQVRSKVSRCHNDMRSLATAIESYTVDCNRAPIGSLELYWLGGTIDDLYRGPWLKLTTPLAYITSIPKDPFRLAQEKQVYNYPLYGCYTYDAFAKNSSYCTYRTPTVYPPRFNLPQAEYLTAGAENGYSWDIYSYGPARNETLEYGGEHPPIFLARPAGDPGRIALVYDPTNGTMSRGYIVRTDHGIYPN